MPAFNYDFAATVLAETAFSGDKDIAKKYGITTRTLRRWRERLKTDERLSAFVRERQRIADKEWANELPSAIKASIQYLRGAAKEIKNDDPSSVRAVTKALEVLAEVTITKEIIDARLARASGPTDQKD